MALKTGKDVEEYLKGSTSIQLNKFYRKQYISRLKKEIKRFKSKNKAGIRGYTKKDIKLLENELKNLDKKFPLLKVKVIVED